MKKLLLTFLCFGYFFAADAQAQTADSQRVVTTVTPAEYFQTRLERLYIAIDRKDTGKMVAYQSDLVGAMRDAINTSIPPETKQKMTNLLEGFGDFSFHNAEKADIDPKLALLEDFLGLLQAEESGK